MIAFIDSLLAASWESLTLGQVMVGTGLVGGGAGAAVVARWIVRTLQASTRALVAVTAHMEASTRAARAGASLAPLAGAALRAYVLEHHGQLPAEGDSDEALRVVADGDDGELEKLLDALTTAGPDSTLTRNLVRFEGRLMELLRAAKRKHGDIPRERPRPKSWGQRLAARTNASRRQ